MTSRTYTGCVAGAATVTELREMLAKAGFTDIRIDIKEASRAFINDWFPGHQAGDYVASANLSARKPSQACCGESCCDGNERPEVS